MNRYKDKRNDDNSYKSQQPVEWISCLYFPLLRFLFIITLANINGKYGKETIKKGG